MLGYWCALIRTQCRELDGPAGLANSIFELVILSLLQGQYDAAWQHYERALSIKTTIGDRSGQADILVQLGHIHYLRGQVRQAQEYYRQAQAAMGG